MISPRRRAEIISFLLFVPAMLLLGGSLFEPIISYKEPAEVPRYVQNPNHISVPMPAPPSRIVRVEGPQLSRFPPYVTFPAMRSRCGNVNNNDTVELRQED